MILQVDNLTKKYREKVAVENISFTVQPGQVMAIVGPNGAGKTTILMGIFYNHTVVRQEFWSGDSHYCYSNCVSPFCKGARKSDHGILAYQKQPL